MSVRGRASTAVVKDEEFKKAGALWSDIVLALATHYEKYVEEGMFKAEEEEQEEELEDVLEEVTELQQKMWYPKKTQAAVRKLKELTKKYFDLFDEVFHPAANAKRAKEEARKDREEITLIMHRLEKMCGRVDASEEREAPKKLRKSKL